MLQIITGRFFGAGTVREEIHRSILYSNVDWPLELWTPVARLFPAPTTRGRISGYVLEYTARYEQREGDPLIMPSTTTVPDQFRVLCALWFKALFHQEESHLNTLCRAGDRGRDFGSPCQYLPRFFDAPLSITSTEITGFSDFVVKVTQLPRARFQLFSQCVSAFMDGLEAIDTNRDLSYSIFVYLLEALSGSAPPQSPEWEDYPQNQRVRLDKAFSNLPSTVAGNIRETLLSAPHLRLRRRFSDFIAAHLSDDYFTTEATDCDAALRKSQLMQVLGTLYDARSGFVHSLKPIQESLRIPLLSTRTDTFEWENETLLTFSGLVRLVRHVLLRFVECSPHLVSESYPEWRNEMPGIIHAKMAPQYWVWQSTGFSLKTAPHYLSGFISQLVESLQAGKVSLPRLHPHMEIVENSVNSAQSHGERAMLAMYELFHSFVSKSDQRPRWKEYLARKVALIKDFPIESLLVETILYCSSAAPPWASEKAWNAYLRSRTKKGALNLPRRVDLAIIAVIANRYLMLGAVPEFRRIAASATLEAAGLPELQKIFRQSRATSTGCNVPKILGIPDSLLKRPGSTFETKYVQRFGQPFSVVTFEGKWRKFDPYSPVR